MKIEELPQFPRRGQVVACLTSQEYGFSKYQVKILFKDGTIKKLPPLRPGERARYSREQIQRDILGALQPSENMR